MEAALTLHQRGHQVTLFEAGDRLGGQLNFADYAPFKSALAKYKQYLIRQVEQSPITVRYQITATRELLLEESYDAVIAAVGAAPIRPGIPGAETAVLAPAIFGAEQSLGEHVVIIGGGQVGCETALHLSRQGKTVTVLEMQDKILADASASYRSRLIRNMDGETNLTVIPGARCTGVGPTVHYQLSDGTAQELPADSVVLAAGMRPEIDAALSLQSHQYAFYMVGDCQRAGNVQKAVRSAFAAASVI